MNSVQIKIAEQITNIAPKVEDSIVAVFVERELEKRSTATVKVLDDLLKLESTLKKIRPDVKTYDADGKVTSESYSKAKADELKKTKERITKYTNALSKALEEGDFENVYNIKNQNPNSDGNKPEIAEDDTD